MSRPVTITRKTWSADRPRVETWEWHRSRSGAGQGFIRTPWGYVWAMLLWKDESTWLEFVHDHKLYRAVFSRRYSRRYVVTLAWRFAMDIVTGSEEIGGSPCA